MFKERLKEARNRACMTQDQVAKVLRIAKSTYAGYETGNSEPDMEKIEQLMTILNVDANFLWRDEIKSSSPNFSKREIDLIDSYRVLDEAGKEFIDRAIAFALRTITDPIAGKPLGRAEEQRPRGNVSASDLTQTSQEPETDRQGFEAAK